MAQQVYVRRIKGVWRFFVISRFFMKLFNTNNMENIKACQNCFSFKLPSVLISIRVNKFAARVKAI